MAKKRVVYYDELSPQPEIITEDVQKLMVELDRVSKIKNEMDDREHQLKSMIAFHLEEFEQGALTISNVGCFFFKDQERVKIEQDDAQNIHNILTQLGKDPKEYLPYTTAGIKKIRQLIEDHPDLEPFFRFTTTKRKYFESAK